MSARIEALARAAPDIVAAWRGVDEGALLSVRREVRRRAGAGSASSIASELAAIAEALTEIVAGLSDDALRIPGGEADWNVAEAVGHAADSRAGLALAASLAATGRWPADAPAVVPGIPGRAEADRGALLRRIVTSQRIVDRAARSVAGHEADPCPLEHPLVGRLRCGEWLLFSGIHDLLHVEQLERLEPRAGLARSVAAR